MFYVMLSGQNCDDNGYCEKENAYLQVWSILLGQFDVADFQSTFSVIAFVAFTFVTFVVLGYALIATSIDIYMQGRDLPLREQRLWQSLLTRIHRRASRLPAPLRPTVDGHAILCGAALPSSSRPWKYASPWDGIIAGGMLGGAVALLLIFLFVSITASMSHMTYYSFVENGGSARGGGRGYFLCQCFASNFIVRWLSDPIERTMLFVVDVDGIHLDGTASTAKYTDSWQGSATHVRCHVKRMLMQSEARTSSKLRNKLFVMEMRHKKADERSRSDVLTEIRASEERMERMISDFQGWMDRRISSKEE